MFFYVSSAGWNALTGPSKLIFITSCQDGYWKNKEIQNSVYNWLTHM